MKTLTLLTVPMLMFLAGACGPKIDTGSGSDAPQDAAVQTDQQAAAARPMTDTEKLKAFWSKLQAAILTDDRATMIASSDFPFNLQDNDIGEGDFSQITFTDQNKRLVKSRSPIRSQFAYSSGNGRGYERGQLWEVSLDGQGIYIAKVRGEFKWVAFYYGE